MPLRRGPTNGHRIINAALPSGMALEVLGEDKANGFTQVRTPNGTDGWVPTQYLRSQPAARDLLAAANKRIESLEAQLKSTREDAKENRTAHSQAENRNNELDKQTKQLQSELAELRRVSATSIAQYEENKVLKADNQDFTLRPIYNQPRGAGEPLFEYLLELAMPDGSTYRGTKWIPSDGLRVLIGRVQLEQSLGTLPGKRP